MKLKNSIVETYVEKIRELEKKPGFFRRLFGAGEGEIDNSK
jgi:hypothetical protein